MVAPTLAATQSPLLAWRDPVHITAGLAGVVALVLLVVQPLFGSADLPGLTTLRSRRLHRWTGATILAALAIHVGGLWMTSPPDIIDALLFRAPTPFSVWGVIAMAAVIVTAALALGRRRLAPRHWRIAHAVLALIIVGGSVAHAWLIIGTMATVTKGVLCCAVVLVTARALSGMRLRASRNGKP
nr:ferric reductase-like transmembrane domain-containing protein [Pseudooceanicola onchidii]